MCLSPGRSKEVKSEPSSLKKDKSIPSSLTELCQQLRARIAQKSQLYSMSHEDQQALVSLKKPYSEFKRVLILYIISILTCRQQC